MNFFKKSNTILSLYFKKVGKGLLDQFYENHVNPVELSRAAYYTNKNLEKQILRMFRQLCADGNTKM